MSIILMFQHFVDRERELEFLEERYSSGKPELLVIYGRRRIGKTALLMRFTRNKPHLYFLAAEKPFRDSVRELKELFADYLNDNLFRLADVGDLETLFREFFQRKGSERVVLIIDEFPVLIEAYRPVVSVLQRLWDTHLSKRRDLVMVLCGSSIGMMETDVLGYRSPLYGRRTGQWMLGEMDFFDIGGFFPTYSVEDLVKVYSVVGGVPGYLASFSGEKSFTENLVENVFSKGGYLYEEAEILLRQELRKPANYFAILRAIAAGKETFGKIVDETGLDKSLVSKYLSVLQNLRIVERELPALTSAKAKTRMKKGRFVITDNYFRFWFRFVYPNRGVLESGELDTFMLRFTPEFNTYLGEAFEDICRKYILRRLLKESFTEVGRWWHKGEEIDIVARNSRLIVAEAKWSNLSAEDAQIILDRLEIKAQKIKQAKKKHYVLLARKIENKNKLRDTHHSAYDLEDVAKLIKRSPY
ncbi:MAG: ATP-binding protein [Candidatus Freyrarchaeum guaymaensis]